MRICHLALVNGHVSLSKNTIRWKKYATPTPTDGQSYCAFVWGEKTTEIWTFIWKDRQTDIVVYREVTLPKNPAKTYK